MRVAFLLPALIAIYLAPNAPALGADPRAAQLASEPWAKSCIAAICFVGSGVRGACHPSGGIFAVIVDNEGLSLSAYLATRQPLKGALSIRIDQGDPLVISDPTCVATNCGGQLAIDKEFVERLKRSRTIAIEAIDASDATIGISLSLAGFSEAFDGPGREPKSYEKIVSSDEMKEMMRRAEAKKRERECKE